MTLKLPPNFEENLILAVSRHRCIFDKTFSISNKHKSVVNAWIQVSKVCEVNGSVCKTKWRNLRDTYRKKKKELSKYKNEDAVVNWKWFSMMSFISDCEQNRTKDSGEISPSHSSGSYVDTDDCPFSIAPEIQITELDNNSNGIEGERDDPINNRCFSVLQKVEALLADRQTPSAAFGTYVASEMETLNVEEQDIFKLEVLKLLTKIKKARKSK